MGKAIIVSPLGAGEYVIKPIYDTLRAESLLTKLIGDLVVAEGDLIKLEDKINPKIIERGVLVEELNVAIGNANATISPEDNLPDTLTKILSEFSKKILVIDAEIAPLQIRRAHKLLSLASIKSEKKILDDSLSKYKNPINVTAWCVDYSVNLSGVVSTIELNDETNKPNDQPFLIGAKGLVADVELLDSLEVELESLIVGLEVLLVELETLRLETYDQNIIKKGELKILKEDLAKLNNEYSILVSELGILSTELSILMEELNELILAGEDTGLKLVEIANKQVEIEDKQTEIDNKQIEITSKQLEVTNKQNEIDDLASVLNAKYLEVSNHEHLITIKEAEIENNGDKLIQPVISSGSFAIVYNSIAMPAFQKWKPRFRSGRVVNIDKPNNEIEVSFTDETTNEIKNRYSSIQGEGNVKYNIFQSDSVIADVRYMLCNTDAFIEGDIVVVAFRNDWLTPLVIGFVDNPYACINEGGDWFLWVGMRLRTTTGEYDGGYTAYNDTLNSSYGLLSHVENDDPVPDVYYYRYVSSGSTNYIKHFRREWWLSPYLEPLDTSQGIIYIDVTETFSSTGSGGLGNSNGSSNFTLEVKYGSLGGEVTLTTTESTISSTVWGSGIEGDPDVYANINQTSTVVTEKHTEEMDGHFVASEFNSPSSYTVTITDYTYNATQTIVDDIATTRVITTTKVVKKTVFRDGSIYYIDPADDTPQLEFIYYVDESTDDTDVGGSFTVHWYVVETSTPLPPTITTEDSELPELASIARKIGTVEDDPIQTLHDVE